MVTADSSNIEVIRPRTSLEDGYDVRIDPEVLACYLYTRSMALKRGYGHYDFNEWLKDSITEHYEEDLNIDVEMLTRRLKFLGDVLVV